MAQDRSDIWKMTAIGVTVAAVTVLVTGLVIAGWMGTTPRATVEAPSASPPGAAEASRATPASPAAPAHAPRREASVPPQSVIEACNRHAATQVGEARDTKAKATEIVKDGAIGAVGGAAVGALGGAIADGGKGAGKGAIIGGLVGAGGGSLYGIYANKQHDEQYRAAYASCMKSRGYTA